MSLSITRAGFGVCGILAVLVYAAAPSEANACRPEPVGAYPVGVPLSVPVDGVVPVVWNCNDCAAPANVEFTVTDEAGQALSGSITDSVSTLTGGYMAWKSDAPLTEGATYVAQLAGDITGGQVLSFVAEGAAPDLAPPSDVEVSIYGEVQLIGNELCCDDGPVDSCGSLPCFVDVEDSTWTIRAYAPVFSVLTMTQRGQFAYRMRVHNDDQDITTDWAVSFAIATESALADEYCYELEARSLATQQTTLLAADCVSAEDVVLADPQPMLEQQIEYGLGFCSVPPADFEAQWCEYFAPAVLTGECEGYEANACASAQVACADAMNTEAPTNSEPEPSDSDAAADEANSGTTNSGNTTSDADASSGNTNSDIDASLGNANSDADASSGSTNSDAGDEGAEPSTAEPARSDDDPAQKLQDAAAEQRGQSTSSDPPQTVESGAGDESSGCGCRVPPHSDVDGFWFALLALGLVRVAATTRRR